MGVVLVVLGCAFVAGAVGLFAYNRHDAARAEDAANDVLSAVERAIAENAARRAAEAALSREAAAVSGEAAPEVSGAASEVSGAAGEASAAELSAEEEPDFGLMPEIEIDGVSYIGVLSLPSIGATLPVSGYLDYARLKIAPCRQFGSVDGDDLVIAGHNYPAHFGSLKSLETGDPVSFTDMNGQVTEYFVVSVSVMSAHAEDEVQHSEWDLVLYTCTFDGRRRVVAGCKRLSGE